MTDLQYSAPLAIDEVKAAGDSWSVSGYVATFGNVDLGGDVVMRGAFDETLADGHKVKFLFAHDMTKPLGVPNSFKIDDKGLFGTFKISKTQLGEDVHTLLKDGAIDSFSMGYFTEDAEYDDVGTRLLKKVELVEASVVSLPMNPKAVVTNVKADQPFGALLKQAADALGLGLTEAEALWARRLQEGREPAESHIEAVKALLAAVEAAGLTLPTLLAPKQAKASGDIRSRLELARARARHAGYLELSA
jgi:HK97 family phage prohead protease